MNQLCRYSSEQTIKSLANMLTSEEARTKMHIDGAATFLNNITFKHAKIIKQSQSRCYEPFSLNKWKRNLVALKVITVGLTGHDSEMRSIAEEIAKAFLEGR